MRLVPTYTLHRYPTITDLFYLINSMDQLTVENNCAKIQTEKNENVSYAWQKMLGEKYITFAIINLIKQMRNLRKLLYYVHMTTYSSTNEKHPQVSIIRFNILVLFNI